MDDDRITGTSRLPRADARRNRDAILRAARDIFEGEGVLVPIDKIAVRAGVGNATLYRHFPTRESLLAAVMEIDLEEARTRATALATERAPRAAFADWLVWLTWRLRIWHGLPPCMADASGEEGSSMNPAASLLMQLTQGLLHRAQEAGVALRPLTPVEVFELATAISWAVDRFGDSETLARRRTEIATAGLFT